MAKLDEHGREVLDQTPRAIPLKHLRSRSSRDEDIRALIRQELSLRAEEQGHETFEEADDFEVGDDYDPESPYEMMFDPEVVPQETAFKEDLPVQRDPEPAPESPGDAGKSDAE